MTKQITEKQIEQIIEKLIDRIELANAYFLRSIGSSIAKIRELTPTQAQKLVQILKYGGRYEDIIEEIARYTNLNIKDIDKIFEQYAKQDQSFYKQFYEYRNKPFVPFEENIALQTQKNALAKIVKNRMYDFTRSNVLGYTIDGKFVGLRKTYNMMLDEALLNVSQGKETFDSAMTRIMKQVGESGLKTIEYQSGRSMRLDSAIRMDLKSDLRELHNENQMIIAEEIDADGVEISVHENPAPDHAPVQGHQFSIVKPGEKELSEWEKLQSGQDAKDYNGGTYNLDHDAKNGYRPISEMNCYHYIFSIVLGVSKPAYSNKELQQIIDRNNKGFEYEGKHYTMYEGEQMQRNLERKIREQKDIQIIAKASGETGKELLYKSQDNISVLTKRYKELSNVSGLPTKMERAKASGYKRVAKNKLK